MKIQNCPATVTGVFVWQVFHKEVQKQGTKPECRLFFWSLYGSARYGSDFPGVFRMEILIYLAFLYTIFHLFIKTISGKMSNL